MIMTKLELDKLLKQKGRRYVLMLHCNWFITLTDRQLDYVLGYKEDKSDNRWIKRKTIRKRESIKTN